MFGSTGAFDCHNDKVFIPGIGREGINSRKKLRLSIRSYLMIANVQLQLSVFLINILANLRSGR